MLHLGDYLYEYANEGYGDGTALGRIPDPLHELVSLEDYRRRHACYKADADLQAAHARHPWITVWDDHESANNAWAGGAQNHDAEQGEWATRKRAAIRAYYEWMPVRELPTGLFRSFRIGDLIDLVMLDTRLAGRDEQGERGDLEQALDPRRTLLGSEQARWLESALSESARGGTAWRVIGQQVVVSPLGDGGGFNPDSWDGYRESRRRLLSHLAREAIEDVVFLTGDVHSSWAFEVPAPGSAGRAYDPETGEGALAVELVTPAVSSPPVARHRRAVETFEDIRARLPHVRYVDLERNGYTVLDVTRERARVQWFHVDTVEIPSSLQHCGPMFEIRRGASRLEPVEPTPCDVPGALGGLALSEADRSPRSPR